MQELTIILLTANMIALIVAIGSPAFTRRALKRIEERQYRIDQSLGSIEDKQDQAEEAVEAACVES